MPCCRAWCGREHPVLKYLLLALLHTDLMTLGRARCGCAWSWLPVNEEVCLISSLQRAEVSGSRWWLC